MSKKCTPFVREAHFEVNMYKTPQSRSTFGSWDVQKVYAVVARSTFRSQNVQNTTCSRHFWTLKRRFAWQAQGIMHLVKSEQNVRVCRIPKNDGRRVTFEEDLQRCIFRGRRCTRDMFIRDVRRLGRWFPERGCILEHQIFRFAKMIFAWQLQHFVWPGFINFSWQAQYFRQVEWEIAKRIGMRPSALQSTVHFWRKSRRIASFLMLSSSKIEKVSQDCFILDVVKFKNWGSFAELLHFQAYRQTDRQIDRQLQLQLRLRYTTATTTNAIKYKYITLHCATLITLHYTTLITSNYTTLHQLHYNYNNYYHNYNYNYATLH